MQDFEEEEDEEEDDMEEMNKEAGGKISERVKNC